jgi:hypothetical protein
VGPIRLSSVASYDCLSAILAFLMLVALGGQNVRFRVVLLQTRPSFARPREDDGSAVPHQGQRHADDTMVQEGECIRGSREQDAKLAPSPR